MQSDIARAVAELKRENRRLKSIQTIPGSAVQVITNTSYAQRITVGAGVAQGGIHGYINFTADGDVSAPIATINAQAKLADMSWDNVLNSGNRPGSNRFQASLERLNNNGSGRLAFVFTSSPGLAPQGFSLDIRLIATGSANIKVTTVEWSAV